MEKLLVSTTEAPAALAAYSQAVKCGMFLFTSGQIALDPEKNEMVKGDVKVQTRRVLDNLKAVLDAADSNLGNVLKVTVYLTDMNDYPKVNEIYSLYFEHNPPARTCVAVSALPRGAKVEIDCVALVAV
ncbi:MAG: hypothetical protein A2284_10065 [Deltaproteobacteria bacterium RIFOXYA12_FULL_61_11]|nr:MAG: hypothetical protein A2284_10065 [Deltaproteobacteria bacterium RIFOXYA12_FULL_61_11]